MAHQCKVYHSFNIDSDHFPVIATLKLEVKRPRMRQNTCFIPHLTSLSKPAVWKLHAATVSQSLDNASADPHSHSRTCGLTINWPWIQPSGRSLAQHQLLWRLSRCMLKMSVTTTTRLFLLWVTSDGGGLTWNYLWKIGS